MLPFPESLLSTAVLLHFVMGSDVAEFLSEPQTISKSTFSLFLCSRGK
jgi:hypothetical protein